MGAYEYVALDSAGKQHKGILEGDTARHVRNQLRERSLLPVSVAETVTQESRRQSAFGGLSLRAGITVADLSLLTRQLATLVRAALPLEEALLAVSQQSEKPRVQALLLGVRARVMEGHPLATALGDYPRVFPEIYRATVAAGEHAGHLDTVLERMADYTEGRQLIRQKVLGALLYPIVLTVFSLGIVSFLLAYVVPKVTAVFANSRAPLPTITRALLALSEFIRTAGPWLLAALVIAAFLFARAMRREAFRSRVHAWILRLPLFGRLVRGFNTARFTRTLSILTASAVPVLEALRISGDVVNNLPMRAAVAEAAARVREGAPIGRSLAKSRLFPPMTIHLISSGESSGELEAMLDRAALNQERELDSLVTGLTGALGPLMIIFMGMMVMGIVFAMLLPIFKLSTLIR